VGKLDLIMNINLKFFSGFVKSVHEFIEVFSCSVVTVQKVMLVERAKLRSSFTAKSLDTRRWAKNILF
jgi:hypothetical protein